MTINAVIFDMNGVIVDDESLHESAFKEVCKKYKINFTSEDYSNLCLGKTDEDGFRSIINKFKISNAIICDMMYIKSKFYLKLIPKKIKPIANVVELIKTLKQRFKIALTSGANTSEIKIILEHFRIEDYFDIIIGAQDVKYSKPSPEPYLLTAKRLGINPKECIVIEDSENGVESAKTAGMFCIGFHSSAIKQNLSKADIEIDNLKEITIKLLDEL